MCDSKLVFAAHSHSFKKVHGVIKYLMNEIIQLASFTNSVSTGVYD